MFYIFSFFFFLLVGYRASPPPRSFTLLLYFEILYFYLIKIILNSSLLLFFSFFVFLSFLLLSFWIFSFLLIFFLLLKTLILLIIILLFGWQWKLFHASRDVGGTFGQLVRIFTLKTSATAILAFFLGGGGLKLLSQINLLKNVSRKCLNTEKRKIFKLVYSQNEIFTRSSPLSLPPPPSLPNSLLVSSSFSAPSFN